MHAVVSTSLLQVWVQVWSFPSPLAHYVSAVARTCAFAMRMTIGSWDFHAPDTRRPQTGLPGDSTCGSSRSASKELGAVDPADPEVQGLNPCTLVGVCAGKTQPGECNDRRGVGTAAAARSISGSAFPRQLPPMPATASPPHRERRVSAMAMACRALQRMPSALVHTEAAVQEAQDK